VSRLDFPALCRQQRLRDACCVMMMMMMMMMICLILRCRYENHKHVKFIAVGDDGGGVAVYNLDELHKLSINNLVAAVPKPAKAAAICEFKPHSDWVTRLVYAKRFPRH